MLFCYSLCALVVSSYYTVYNGHKSKQILNYTLRPESYGPKAGNDGVNGVNRGGSHELLSEDEAYQEQEDEVPRRDDARVHPHRA